MFIATLYIGLAVVIIYCLFNFWLLWQWRTHRAKKDQKAINFKTEKNFIYPTIDIILSVRNESHLQLTIDSLAKLDYPKSQYRVIIVDDFTNDKESVNGLKQIERKTWPIPVDIIHLSNELSASYASVPNKKRALTLGSKTSKASFLAFTDGDCIAHPGWLKAIAEEIHHNRQCKMVIAGIKPIDQDGFIRHFAMMEQAALTVLSGASLMAGIPLMANGANLLISREVFEEVKGYSPWEEKPSGDDIILLRKVNDKYPDNIAFAINPRAIMRTQFPSDISTFWNQRRRWASKTFAMPSRQITAVMMLMIFTQLFLTLFLVIFGIGLYCQNSRYVLIACTGISVKTLIDGMLIFYGAKYAQYPLKLVDYLLMPFFQVINVLYNVVLGLQSLVSNGKGYLWKGRRVNTNP